MINFCQSLCVMTKIWTSASLKVHCCGLFKVVFLNGSTVSMLAILLVDRPADILQCFLVSVLLLCTFPLFLVQYCFNQAWLYGIYMEINASKLCCLISLCVSPCVHFLFVVAGEGQECKYSIVGQLIETCNAYCTCNFFCEAVKKAAAFGFQWLQLLVIYTGTISNARPLFLLKTPNTDCRGKLTHFALLYHANIQDHFNMHIKHQAHEDQMWGFGFFILFFYFLFFTKLDFCHWILQSLTVPGAVSVIPPHKYLNRVQNVQASTVKSAVDSLFS